MKKIFRPIYIFYTPRYLGILVYMLRVNGYKAWPYLKWYWSTQNFARIIPTHEFKRAKSFKVLLGVLYIGSLVQILAGLYLVYLWHWHNLAGGLAFGLAVIVSYPIVWAHLLPFIAKLLGLSAWPRPKRLGKAIVCTILEAQVKRLRRRHQFKLIAVVGSVGKTSTKLAIVETLAASRSVRYQEGNYNDRVTVPLVLFGHSLPGLFNMVAWLKIILANRRIIRGPYPYECVVVELGADGPGQLAYFSYLRPEITVVTALTPEHMEYFGTLEAVAAEELSVLSYSEQTLINLDDSPTQFLKGKQFVGYGFDKKADYHVADWRQTGLEDGDIAMELAGGAQLEVRSAMIGRQGAKIALAAAAVAHMLGLSNEDIVRGLEKIKPFVGRMQILEGIRASTIIDDTYNASPAAVEAALDVLYATKTPQRIAILGNMNELGSYSAEAHREVGAYCDSKKLAWVVTIGPDAEKYLAAAAREAGCQVQSFSSPYKAGEFVKEQLAESAVVLAEGSQNGVFAEEALKTLLKNPKDKAKLVRQSAYWLKIKRRQFPKS